MSQGIHSLSIKELNAILVTSIDTSILFVDTALQVIFFSDTFRENYQHHFGQYPRIGDSIISYAPPGQRKQVRAIYKRALSGKTIEEIIKLKFPNGVTNSVIIQVRPVYLDEGKLIGVSLTTRDVSGQEMSRKPIRNEISLKSVISLSDEIINSLPGIFYLYTKEGQFLRWNKNFSVVSGYSDKEIQQLSPLNFFAEDEHELLTMKIQNVFKSGTDTVEAHFLTKKHKRILYYFTGVSLSYQNQECLMGVGINIEDKERAKLELAKNEESLKRAQAISHQGSWELNLANNQAFWSEEMYRVLGLDSSASPSLDLFMKMIHPNDRKYVSEIIKESKSTNHPVSFVHRIIRPDGAERKLRAELRILKNKVGLRMSLFGIAHDVTEQMDALDNLERANARLKTAQQIAKIGYWEWDWKSNETYCSEEMCNLLGLPSSNKKAPDFTRFIKSIHHKDRPGVLEQIEKLKKTRQPLYAEFSLVWSDRTIRDMILQLEPSTDSNATQLDGTLQDVTELMDHVRTIQLQNDRLMDIAWTQSHLVRAPLARLMGLVGLFNDAEFKNKEQKKIINFIRQAAKELDEIVRVVVRKTEQVQGIKPKKKRS